MLVYPEGLPLPLRDGYSFTPVSPIRRSEKVSGRAVQRRLYTSVPTIVAVSWLCTARQARLFEGWCKWGIGWADWFLCPLKTPLGLNPTRARFTDIYDGPALVGIDLWRYSATLELFEMPVVSEAELLDLMLEMDLTVMNPQLSALLNRWYTKSWPASA